MHVVLKRVFVCANIFINLFKKENDLIKKLATGEIESANFEGKYEKINEDFVKDLMRDLTFSIELSKLIEKYGLSTSELLDPDTIENNASSILKDKYKQNIKTICKAIRKTS